MPSLRDDGENVRSRDHGGKRALQLTCGAALLATSAFAWATLLRPDSVSAGLSLNSSASLVIGLAGLAALGLVAVSARANRPAPIVASGNAGSAEPDVQDNLISQLPGVSPMRANATELVKAVAAARISRILLLAPAEEKVAEAVILARHLADGGEPTILVDFDGGATVGDLALLRNVESIAHIAASPTTFAHGIQRDRSGRTHVLAARLDAPNAGSETASVLATLEEVYARVVAVLPADPVLIGSLVHADTALVVPRRIERDPGLTATIGNLASRGFGEIILLDAKMDERADSLARRPVAMRA